MYGPIFENCGEDTLRSPYKNYSSLNRWQANMVLLMGLTRLSVWWKGSDDSSDEWMTLHMCKWRCKPPSTHSLAWCTTSSITLRLTLMIKSCKDLSLGEVPGAQVWVLTCLMSFPVFPVILSLVSLAVPLLSSWVLVWIASISSVNWVNKRTPTWHS
jgi:hypothetical protein